MTGRVVITFFLLSVAVLTSTLLVIPGAIADSACTINQTQAYLASGTNYAFTQKNVDYVIVIDRSGSMAGTKLDTVKEAAKKLIDQMAPSDRAAIISFDYTAILNQGLTTDHTALDAAIDQIRPGYTTKFTLPLILAAEQFNDTSRAGAMIFLSDGLDDTSEPIDELDQLTQTIAEKHVCIMTITYAVEGEGGPQLLSMANVGKSVAGCGENYIASQNGTELEDVFTKIHNIVASTDVIRIAPHFTGTTYSFAFSSKLNNQPIPGANGQACTDPPEFSMGILKDGALVTTLAEASGTLSLPDGTYTYEANAFLHCGGACSYSGSEEGTFSLGDTCSPTYAQLSSYVAGATRVVTITSNGFVPHSIAAQQGAVVVWNNNDTVAHTITSPFFNETIQAGSSFDYVVDTVGTLVFSDASDNATGTVEPLAGSGTDFALVIDESGSMAGAGIDEARSATRQFLSILAPSDRVAIITFSQQATLAEDFTSDVGILGSVADGLHAEDATSYLPALRLVNTLHPVQRKILVFMSDGLPTDPEGQAAILAQTAALRASRWCIMTIGFGDGGTAARDLLSSMAGQDACSAFLYAGAGGLGAAFGTVYQLATDGQGLHFTSLSLPRITFETPVRIRTALETATGKPVPGGTGVCAPEASVQARTVISSTTLDYANGTYSGSLGVQPGLQAVSLTASVASTDDPERPFVGSFNQEVLFIPPSIAVALLLSLSLSIAIVIYRFRHRIA